jgi:hypothetical protein
VSIFDLIEEDPEPVAHRFIVLEYGLTGRVPWRGTAWGSATDSIEAAQEQVREKHTGLEFVDPPTHLLVGGNLGDVAYKNRWNVACIYRVDTGEVVSVGWVDSTD